MSANDKQIGGSHYKKGGEEHWDRAARLDYDPFQYIITKWIERWRDKGGIEDLRKAHHAIEKYIEVVEAGLLIRGPTVPPPIVGPGVVDALIPSRTLTVQIIPPHEHEYAHFNKFIDGKYEDWLKCIVCGHEIPNTCVSCPD